MLDDEVRGQRGQMARIRRWLSSGAALAAVLLWPAPPGASSRAAISPLWNTTYGNDHFGHWIVDRFGLPAFDYTDDEERDPLARWNTGSGQSTAFWHQVGNDRITAMADNDGYVQVWDGERQYGYANRYDSVTRHYAGGYGYVGAGAHSWSTHYPDRPADSSYRRTFGIGYVETEEHTSGIDTRQTTFAPFGSEPALLSQITLTNTGHTLRSLRYVEYWDVNPMVVPAKLGGNGAVVRQPPQATSYDASLRTLIPLPARGVCPTPHAVFLAALSAPVDSFETSLSRFFGRGRRAHPAELARARLSNSLLRRGCHRHHPEVESSAASPCGR